MAARPSAFMYMAGFHGLKAGDSGVTRGSIVLEERLPPPRENAVTQGGVQELPGGV